MKKLLFIILLSIPVIVRAQISFSYNFCAENLWGEWKSSFSDVVQPIQHGFIIYSEYNHPSDWKVKVIFNADNNKKNIKERYKNKIWEETRCIVIFRANKKVSLKELMQISFLHGGYEQQYSGWIKIAPYKYKKGMRTFNIFIKDYGLAISLTNGSIVWIQ